MKRVTHKYIVSLHLLDKITKYIDDHDNITISELKDEFHRLKLFYRCGLSHLDD